MIFPILPKSLENKNISLAYPIRYITGKIPRAISNTSPNIPFYEIIHI